MNVQVRRIDPPIVGRLGEPGTGNPEDPGDLAWAIEEIAPAGTDTRSRPIAARDWRLYAAIAAAAAVVGFGVVGRAFPGGGAAPAASAPAVATAGAASVPPSVAPAGVATPAAGQVSLAIAPLTLTCRADGATGSDTSSASSAASAATAAVAQEAGPPAVHTVRHIDRAFVEPGSDGSVISVWMETGSTSAVCLATLNEAAPPASVAPVTLFCAARDAVLQGSTRHGLFLHMFLGAPMGDGYYDVNAYQEGASSYSEPILWPPQGT